MYDSTTCNRYWQEAVAIDNRIHTAHRIKVNNEYCYNPNILDPTKGWCEIAYDPRKWGVCSPMCQQTFMKVCVIRINLTIPKFKYITLFKCIFCTVRRTWGKFLFFHSRIILSMTILRAGIMKLDFERLKSKRKQYVVYM